MPVTSYNRMGRVFIPRVGGVVGSTHVSCIYQMSWL